MSPKVGDRHYNRMKYYSALKTNAIRHETTNSVLGKDNNDPRNMQSWLDIPEHMLQINESAFVPSYGGKYASLIVLL